jgi:hypothetical protein
LVQTPITCFQCRGVALVDNARIGVTFGCPHCGTQNQVASLPVPAAGLSTGQVMARAAGAAVIVGVAGFAGYRLFQLVTDSWEGGPDRNDLEFRAAFKAQIVTAHVRRHGYRCLECRGRVRRRVELHVDHRRTVRDGGGPWRSNAQVRCRRCNLRKGGRSSLVEYMTGR